MELDYQSMRTFADSWGLLYMFLIFLGMIIWVFRPGSKKLSIEASEIPFKRDAKDER